MDRDQALFHDVLDEERVPAAVEAVVDAHHGNACCLGLGRRDFGASERRDVAHLIAAIDQCGRRRFPHDPDRLAYFIGALVGRDGQDARQAREAVAAQGVVHQLVHDNRCILGGVANAPQRAFADGPRLGFRDADGLGAISIQKFL